MVAMLGVSLLPGMNEQVHMSSPKNIIIHNSKDLPVENIEPTREMVEFSGVISYSFLCMWTCSEWD